MRTAVIEHTATDWRGFGTNVAVLVVATLVALAILEVMARIALPPPPPWLYPQLQYRAAPAVIFAPVPNQHSYTGDKPVVINERGLRGPIVPYERTPGRERILFIGDSITFGAGVPDDATSPIRLERLLAARAIPAEVINGAVPAYNTEQEIAFLETEGLRYRPEWVIVGVCWNDIGDKSEVQVDTRGALTEGGAPRQRSVLERISESSGGYAVRNLLKRSRLLYGTLQGVRAVEGRLSPDEHMVMRTDVLEGNATRQVEDGWRRVDGALRRLKDLAAQHGFRVLIVPYPVPLALERSYPHSSYPARLKEIAARAGLPLLDLEPAYRAAFHGHESLFIAYDGDHPNEAGHEVAAAEIARFLMDGDGLRANDERRTP